MTPAEQLHGWLPQPNVELVNAARLHHDHARVLRRAAVEGAAAVGAQVARHLRAALDGFGVGVQRAHRRVQVRVRDHEVRGAEEGAGDLAVVQAGAHELWSGEEGVLAGGFGFLCGGILVDRRGLGGGEGGLADLCEGLAGEGDLDGAAEAAGARHGGRCGIGIGIGNGMVDKNKEMRWRWSGRLGRPA